MEVSSSSAGDWTNLLIDSLISIARRLSVADYANFAAVCTSWAAIASPENGMPPPISLKQIPYLLLPGDDGEQSESCTLIDVFDNNRSYKIDPLPEIRGKWCVGSQFGWLAVVDELSNPSLLNPLTRSQIDLPPITTLSDVNPVYNPDGCIQEYLLRQAIHVQQQGVEFRPWSLQLFRCIGIKKLVLSAPPTQSRNFVAMAMFECARRVIYVRPGEKEWTPVDMFPLGGCPRGALDILRREDGKFLVLSQCAYLQEVDLNGPSGIVQVRTIADGFENHCENMYIVDSDGDLLLVCREGDYAKIRRGRKRERMFKTYKFEVYKLNPETAEWDRIRSLGNKSLFLGLSYSMVLTPREVPGVRPDCVYFTDDYWDLMPFKMGMVRDIGIYNLIDGTVEVIHPPNPQMTWPPPVWIIPSLQ